MPFDLDLTGLLEGVSRKELEARAAKLSAAYRQGGTSAAVAGRLDALAYLVVRFPATHAAADAALRRTAQVCPQFAPESLLDVGAGPGTVALAGRGIWPSLQRITLLEPNRVFRDLAKELCPDAGIVAGSLDEPLPSAEVVTAAYVLAELGAARIPQAARTLWRAASHMLVLVEPGTPQGFAHLRAARQALIQEGARIAAPCGHDRDCPISGSDWCHFSQRLARSRDHRIVKSASLPFEDERYAYLAASRTALARSYARIVKPVVEQKPALLFSLCDESGLSVNAVPRRDKEAFRAARKKRWGDIF